MDNLGVVEEYVFHLDGGIGADTVPPAHVDDYAWVAPEPPSGWDLRIMWGSGLCDPAPQVDLAGRVDGPWEFTVDMSSIVLREHGAPDDQEVCPALPAYHAVDLRTSVAPPDDIRVAFIDVEGERR